MDITLKFFSNLMEYLPHDAQGNALELIERNDTTPNQLLERFKVPQAEIQTMMLNGVFLPIPDRDQPMNDGDTLSVWPAIQGG